VVAAPGQLHRYVLPLLHLGTSMNAHGKLSLAFLAVAALVLGLMPWSTAVVPAVRVQVFDETGKAGAGVRVEQEWQFFASNSDLERATSTADAAGYVTLPKRTVRISLASRAFGFARSLLPVMCGYEYGPFGSITAYGSDPRVYDVIVYDFRHPNPRPLKLKRWDLIAH
jgi:hypothetical protein